MTARNPYLFVGGCPRSGTMLLQRMLDHHPLIALGNDSHFIPKCITERTNPSALPLSSEMVECVRTYPRFKRLRLEDSAADRAAEGSNTYGEFVSRIYTEFASAHGKEIAGEKTPDYIRQIPLLDSLFPWARFIHVLRDGRDVALSVQSWATKRGRRRGPSRRSLWDEEPIAASAIWWSRFVVKGRKDGENLSGERYMEVRFEALAAEPRETLEGVLSFLELPFSDEALLYHEGRTRPKAGRSAKNAWLPPTPGLRDWRTTMPPTEVELFEAMAGDVLDELGYERAFPRISPRAVSLADRCRARWTSERPHDPAPAR
jgi:hypothetical protein